MLDTVDVTQLVQSWLSGSIDYRNETHWLRAAITLRESDPRILLVGPGPKHPLHYLTEATESFLKEVGFHADTIGSNFDIRSHRSRVNSYPRILALPISAGSAAEVLDIIGVDASKLCVVVPDDCAENYCIRLIEEEHRLHVRRCGAGLQSEVGRNVEMGAKILARIAQSILQAHSVSTASELTDESGRFASVQGRSSAKSPPALRDESEGDIVDTGSRKNPWLSGSFYLCVFLVFCLTFFAGVADYGITVTVTVAILGMVAALMVGLLQLRQDQLLSDKSFTELIKIFATELLDIIKRKPKTNGQDS